MPRKTTLGDIAKLADVAPGTVYKALSGNKGVSEQKRKEIISLARSLNYVLTNHALPARRLLIALFPSPVGDDRYFYQYIWEGIARRETELADTGLHVIKVTFDGTQENQKDRLEEIFSLYKDTMFGLLTIIWEESEFLETLNKFSSVGIKIFTVSSDAPSSHRSGCVMADSYRTGRLAAEYLGSVIKGKARVIVVGTKRDSYNHAQVVRGFFDQMNTTNPQIQIIELYESRMYPEEVFKTLQDFLSRFEDIKGIYANNARTTIRILETAREQKQHRKLFVVGSELFDESSRALREGTLDAIIAQNAFQQAYEGVNVAFRSLSGTEQITTKEIVPNALYLRNNLPLEQQAKSQSIIQMLDKEFLKDSEKAKQDSPRKTT